MIAIESILEKVEMAMGVACRDTEYVGDIKIDVDSEKKKIRFPYKIFCKLNSFKPSLVVLMVFFL